MVVHFEDYIINIGENRSVLMSATPLHMREALVIFFAK